MDWELYRPLKNQVQEPATPTLDTPEKTPEKTSEKTSEKILTLLIENSGLTIAEMAQTLGTSTRTIERNLKKLQDAKRLKRIGADKGGYWEVQK